MELKIERNFTDKYNGTKYELGKIYDFTKERAEELLNDPRKLVSKIEELKVEETNEELAEDKPTNDDLSVLTDEELKEGAEEQAKQLLENDDELETALKEPKKVETPEKKKKKKK